MQSPCSCSITIRLSAGSSLTWRALRLTRCALPHLEASGSGRVINVASLSGKRVQDAASMVREAISTARAAGATGPILVRGDSAYGNSAVVGACVKAKVRFSVVLTKNRKVAAAISAIPEDAWTPVAYPGAVLDPDTGKLLSDAEVAETTFTAFASTDRPVTARLVVRRVRDANPDHVAVNAQGELFRVWRHHAVFTDSPLPMLDEQQALPPLG